MKHGMVLALSLVLLGGCSEFPVLGDHIKHEPPRPAGDGDDGRTNEAGDKIVAGFALRMIDNATRAKLGLKPDDVLVAVTNDANTTQNTIVYVSEEFTAAPGEFIPGKKLEKFVQIFMQRGSPLCGWIWDGRGGRIYYQAPHCPHPVQN